MGDVPRDYRRDQAQMGRRIRHRGSRQGHSRWGPGPRPTRRILTRSASTVTDYLVEW